MIIKNELKDFNSFPNLELNQTLISNANGSSDTTALQNQINDLDDIVSSQQVSLAELNQAISDNYASE